ncbi:MAG: hypothetical protein GX233_00575 [Erysipelothrix sp.]|nr:hypothetical protein [Erysipelothrix sp.]NLL74255.1 hypothetical protein [Erysipelothrix sp.]
MKTRVSRNKELHQTIATDTESTVESSDLSHFANRLNEIDNQFSRMNVEKKEDRILEHARQTDVNLEDTLDQSVDVNDTQFDTFESAYLKDFLAEVKDYNVKKGYRDIENTSSNIMKELRLESLEKSRSISDIDEVVEPFVNPIDSNDLEKVLTEIDEEATQIYQAVDHNSRPEHVSVESMEQTIAMAVQSMGDEDYEAQDENYVAEEEIVEEEFAPAFFVADAAEEESVEPNAFARELMEQTQTLQFKIVDQERSIEEMGDTIVRTNRLLNTVLSLLMLAIVVVLMFIFSNIMKG